MNAVAMNVVSLATIEDARHTALFDVKPVSGNEIVPLREAVGRVLADTVFTPHDLPPFDQSAMDGYAVRTSDLIDGRLSLPVVARRAAGASHELPLPSSPSALRIFTGAQVPDGFDAVVMQEHVLLEDGVARFERAPKPGDNVRHSGEDVPRGCAIMEAGVRLDSRHVAILAAAGVPRVRVRRRVRVAVLSTGSELREPGATLQEGEIHDSNRAMLLALLDRPGVQLFDLGTIGDTPNEIASAFASAAAETDVVISTGGISVGEEDHVRHCIAEAGGKVAALRAAIKPGKPAAVGRMGSAVLVGLPGNPVAALVTFLWFARPIVELRMGLNPLAPRGVPAKAGFSESRRPGRDEFIPVRINSGTSELSVEKLGRAGSSRLSPLLGADGFARIPAAWEAVHVGDPLSLYLFDGAFPL